MTGAFYVVTPELPARPFPADRAVLVGEWERLTTARLRYETRLRALVSRRGLPVATRWRQVLKEIEVLQRRLSETGAFLREVPLGSVEAEARAVLEAREAVAIGLRSLDAFRDVVLRGAEGDR